MKKNAPNTREFVAGILENLIAAERMAAAAGVKQEGFAALHGVLPKIESLIQESYQIARPAKCGNPETLIHFQKWRRGEEIEPVNPTEVGKALDWAIAELSAGGIRVDE
ncbi:MAG: hypothetical protein AB7T01_02465 [Acidithiobacillus sp.]